MKICLECAEGGHFDEMLSIMDAFQGHDVFFITTKAASTEGLSKKARVYYVRSAKNARKRIQVILMELYYMVKLFPLCTLILLKEKPKVIVSVGGGSTIPLCFMGKLLRTKIVYISSLARVDEPSFTGKVIYHIADLFLVQWKRLLPKYPKAQYWGKVI